MENGARPTRWLSNHLLHSFIHSLIHSFRTLARTLGSTLHLNQFKRFTVSWTFCAPCHVHNDTPTHTHTHKHPHTGKPTGIETEKWNGKWGWWRWESERWLPNCTAKSTAKIVMAWGNRKSPNRTLTSGIFVFKHFPANNKRISIEFQHSYSRYSIKGIPILYSYVNLKLTAHNSQTNGMLMVLLIVMQQFDYDIHRMSVDSPAIGISHFVSSSRAHLWKERDGCAEQERDG